MVLSPRHLYFPGLDSLRFYAALAVVVSHIKSNVGDPLARHINFAWLNLLFVDAQSAVSLFFVLSGFLITYLLLKESAAHGNINITKFYIRRALRIWPLYYAVAALGFIGLPVVLSLPWPVDWISPGKVFLSLIFLPNLVLPIGAGPLGHLWSIGVEEQFYLIWPWVVKQSPLRFLKIVFGIIAVKVLIAPAISLIQHDAVSSLYHNWRFESMAIGALGAYLYFHNHPVLNWIYSPWTQAASWAGVIVLLIVNLEQSFVSILSISVLYLVFILNLATNPKAWWRADYRISSALGRMSYGVYLFHYPVIYAAVILLRQSAWFHEYSSIFYVVVILVTISLAILSFYWFESPFLKLKQKFTII